MAIAIAIIIKTTHTHTQSENELWCKMHAKHMEIGMKMGF